MDATSSLAGALAERYTIEREIGRGGMATVYLARDIKHDRHDAVVGDFAALSRGHAVFDAMPDGESLLIVRATRRRSFRDGASAHFAGRRC